MLLFAAISCLGCDPGGEDENKDKLPAFDYSPEPSEDLSLKDYDRVIFDRFQLFPGVKEQKLALEFPEQIYHKMNYHYPNAFKDVRLWSYDMPGLLVTGVIVEYNPVSRLKRLIPSGRGTAVFGVEVVLRDNLSNREISSFSMRTPFRRPDLDIDNVMDQTAKDIAGYLAASRGR
ncbi:MAG: hypothetical protein U5N86_02470 [Planctomycetota bacterium]|nr:hypothetical protein [Planctomycetota bacterium]